MRGPIGQLLQHFHACKNFGVSGVRSGSWLSSFDVALLQAGEQSGRLPDVFRVLSNYYGQRAQLARQVIMFALYPLIVFHVAVLIFPIGILTDVVTKGALGTFFLQKLAVFVPVYALAFFIAFAMQGTHAESWRASMESLMSKVPVLGKARRCLAIARLSLALDALLNAADSALRTLFAKPRASRTCPTVAGEDTTLSVPDKALAGALMRVNHVGEVCAQALYASQALSTRNPVLRQQFLEASKEEGDHLAWCAQRLNELGSRTSLLNPVWYAGAFAIGAVAGVLGDRISLGFVAETERQVEGHLEGHLQRLPPDDSKSRRILDQMKADEAQHGQMAQAAGGTTLPAPIPQLMRLTSQVMTRTAYWI